jgi:UDP-2,4-diacetamido-2,4,6-trideoxy-beta-L-altropyranose hydrolase
MKILFRVDASIKIGTGHVMRCLTLANELKNQGETTIFCSRHLTDTLAGIIQAAGHQLIRLANKESIKNESIDQKTISSEPCDQYTSWLGTSQKFDADEMVSSIKMEDIDWVIVDHYALDFQWQRKIKDNNKNIKLLVINDLFEKSHDCELFLNQNIVQNKDRAYQSLLNEEVSKLIGPSYALLRDEFNEYRQGAKVRRAGVKNILIFFGGVDINNTTGKTLVALSKIKNQDLNVKVVVGATHPKIDELDKFCDSFGFSLHVQVNNMAELIVWADVSIGASGSATWERSCLGLPTIVVSLADNQIPIAEAANDAGLVFYLGKDADVSPSDITNAVSELRDNPQRLARMSEACFDSVDGLGKKRVVDKIREIS